MNAKQQRLEVEPAVRGDHDLAVQHEARRRRRPPRGVARAAPGSIGPAASGRATGGRAPGRRGRRGPGSRPTSARSAIPSPTGSSGGRLGQHRLDGRRYRERHEASDDTRAPIGHTPARHGDPASSSSGAVGTVTGSQFLVPPGSAASSSTAACSRARRRRSSRNRIPFAFEAGERRRAAADPRAPRPLRPHSGPGRQGRLHGPIVATSGHRRTSPRSCCATRPSCRTRPSTAGAASTPTRRPRTTPSWQSEEAAAGAPPKDDEALPERICAQAAPAGHDHDPGRALRRARRGDRPSASSAPSPTAR